MSVGTAHPHSTQVYTLGEASLIRVAGTTTLVSQTADATARVDVQAVPLGRGLNPVAVAERIKRDLAGNGLDELLVETKSGDLYLVYGTELAGDPRAGDVFRSDALRGRVLMASAEPRPSSSARRWATGLFVGGLLLSGAGAALLPAIAGSLAPGAMVSGAGLAIGLLQGISGRRGADLSSISGFLGTVAEGA